MSDRSAIMTGGCQCGAVRFAVYAVPGRSYLCHCRMCQKAAAGPFGHFTSVAAEDFAWTRGRPRRWASSSLGEREFCGDCGTQLGYRYREGEPRQYLTGGSFDRPDLLAPREQVGMESRLAWLDHLADLPSLPTGQALGVEALSRLRDNQHPDHDTPTWQPVPPSPPDPV